MFADSMAWGAITLQMSGGSSKNGVMRCPVAAPGFDEGRVVGTPLVIELLLLDLSWVSRHPFAQLPTDAVQAVAHLMHQAKLHARLGVHRFNGFGEILHAIRAGDEESR